jgi:DNA repair exonuclease SbcCD nuclease subunit
MKFIHIADVHLGAKPESERGFRMDREKEIYETFYRVLQKCEDDQVDLLLIAGDLFHRQPLLRELKEINYMLNKLTRTKVIVIAGNHDYLAPKTNYLEMNWSENTLFLSAKEMDSIYLEDINTEVYGFSYHTRDIYEAKYSNVFAGVEERINILLAHGGDERNIPINYKQLANTGFDYIALGHIHKPEIFSDSMAYCGSLEPLDKNELGEHGYIEGTIEKDEANQASTQIRFVPFSKREYKRISVLVTSESTNLSVQENSKQMIQEQGEQHMYQILLEGRKDPDLLINTQALQELGNVMEVIDQTVLDYDFDVLYQENKDNLVGAYISKITNSSEDAQLREKALYYGIQALLNAKER